MVREHRDQSEGDLEPRMADVRKERADSSPASEWWLVFISFAIVLYVCVVFLILSIGCGAS